MSLRAHQERVLAHLLRAPRDTERDAALHPRWDLYRDMVRARLLDLARGAYPRTRRVLGGETFDRLVESALASRPPTTPYFWRVATGLGDELALGLEASGSRPFLVELLRLEQARWLAKHEAHAAPAERRDFAFDAPPLVEPSVRLLAVSHAVESDFDGAPPERRATLAVYAKRSSGEVSVFVLNDAAAELLAAFCGGEGTATELALAVARARGSRIDESWFESIGTLLAAFLEAGILLGSRL